jgi:hypothetical protein
MQQDEPTTRTLRAAAQRPENYPADLPFVPCRPVELSMAGSELRVAWHGVDRPFDLVQQLIGASAQDGWTREERQQTAAPSRRVRLSRAGVQREIDVVQAGPFSSVVLKQREMP